MVQKFKVYFLAEEEVSGTGIRLSYQRVALVYGLFAPGQTGTGIGEIY
jgi:hypothetical protein